jgi:putative transposase
MKDRSTVRRRPEAIYARNDGYRQKENSALVLSRNLRIPFKAGDLWIGKQGRLELHFDGLRGKWYGHIPVKIKWPRKGKPHHSTLKRASIDLGICNLMNAGVNGA